MTTQYFEWDPEKATLLLPIPHVLMERRIMDFAAGQGFMPKAELHITLISFQNGKKILQALAGRPDREEGLADVFSRAKAHEWTFEYVPEYFVLERSLPEYRVDGEVKTSAHVRQAIIQPVKLPDLENFYHELSDIVGFRIEAPFAHVTLFSWSDLPAEMQNGIAVNSKEDFERLVKGKV